MILNFSQLFQIEKYLSSVVLYKKAEQKRLDIKQNQVQGTVAKAQIPSQHIAI